MTETDTIYGMADVAQLLRVTRAAVSNYRTRYDDTPAPNYITVDGRLFWTRVGMAQWALWLDKLRSTSGHALARSAASAAVEKLREELDLT